MGGGVPFPPGGWEGERGVAGVIYQTRQRLTGAIGEPAGQLQAFWNSGLLVSAPSTR